MLASVVTVSFCLQPTLNLRSSFETDVKALQLSYLRSSEELLAGSPLLSTSKRVSWESGPGQLKIRHKVQRGVALVLRFSSYNILALRLELIMCSKGGSVRYSITFILILCVLLSKTKILSKSK